MRNNNISAPKNFALVLAKKEFVRSGKYADYIEQKFNGYTPLWGMTKSVPVEPGVVYRCELRTYDTDKTQDLEVLGFTHVACLDWDWPDIGHIAQTCVTISSYNDVRQRLIDSGETWRVYITPGGVRAFCMSRAYHPEVMPTHGADPLYINLCKKTEVYWARVVPKKERPLDWVAEYVETIGDEIDPSLLNLVVKYHDDLIVANRGYKELSKKQRAIIEAHLTI